MLAEETYTEQPAIAKNKLSDYILFVKLRLATSVVFSAAVTYAFFANEVDWLKMLMLVVGGFLVTGASNGFNQVIEKDLDKLMDRTKNRPLAAGRMTVQEGLIVAGVFGLAGTLILWIFINPMSGLLGALAMALYAVVYTPMKRVTPFAVFIGAFPGAIPPLLGAVAATEGFGTISFGGLIMFGIQFMWQFPHFWSIAWVLDDDYKKAGFKMLPSDLGRSRNSAFQVLVYTFALFPIVLLPFAFKITGDLSAVIVTVLTIVFSIQAIKLYKSCEIADARRLMFSSFIYLPLVQLAYLLDKI
jgi:heme o synthase